MSQRYRCKPSDVLYIPDGYEAFCFNEACEYITRRLEDGEEPKFKKKFSSFADMYGDLERRGTKCR